MRDSFASTLTATRDTAFVVARDATRAPPTCWRALSCCEAMAAIVLDDICRIYMRGLDDGPLGAECRRHCVASARARFFFFP
jgi:hypothetical protein